MATEKDRVNAGLIATICIAGTLVVWAVVMVLTAYTRAEVREQREAVEGTANLGAKRRHIAAEYEDMHAKAEWWDPEAKVVKIPTTHAEVLVVRDIQADPYAATRGAAPPPPVEVDADAGAEGAEGADGTEGEPAEGATPNAPAPSEPAPAPAPAPAGN